MASVARAKRRNDLSPVAKGADVAMGVHFFRNDRFDLSGMHGQLVEAAVEEAARFLPADDGAIRAQYEGVTLVGVERAFAGELQIVPNLAPGVEDKGRRVIYRAGDGDRVGAGGDHDPVTIFQRHGREIRKRAGVRAHCQDHAA